MVVQLVRDYLQIPGPQEVLGAISEKVARILILQVEARQDII
jgi:hypothetical protein